MQSEAGTVVARQKVRDEACGPESWVCLRAGHPHINILKPKPLTSALVFDQLMRNVLSCKQCTMFICTRALPLRFWRSLCHSSETALDVCNCISSSSPGIT